MTLRNSDLELLVDVSRIISSKLNLKELLETIMECATRVVRAEASSLLLVDEKTHELYFDVALGDKGDEIKTIRLKMGEGIAGWVAKNKAAAVVNDVSSDSRWTQKADDKTSFNTKAILAVPLLAKGRVVGVIEAINRLDNQPFSDEDQKIFEAFASQAAVAIENAQLFSKLKEEKDKIETVFSEMSDGALLIDEVGQTVLYNNGACRLLGLGDREYYQLKVDEMLKDFEIMPSIEDIMKKEEDMFPIEMVRRKGKVLVLQGIVNRLTSDDGSVIGYLSVFRDVTIEKREERLKRNFLSLISHKLKTPLVSINGYIPIFMEDSERLTEFQKKALNTIKNQGSYLANLVEKLINYTIVEEEQLKLIKKKIPVNLLVTEALIHLKNFVDEKNTEILKDGSLKVMPDVFVDRERMREALKNVIENGIKFNNSDIKKVTISARSQDNFVYIDILDNGPGIPSEEQEKIFQKFYQIEESFTGQVEGVGLGLAFARMVLEAHDGGISVQSIIGQGSHFILVIPIAETNGQ
ncbi:MAG: ATP-binding protein [bacterium]